MNNNIKRVHVSFIDKDIMCAISPNFVEVYPELKLNNEDIFCELAAYTYVDGKEKEVEIKIIN